MDHWFSLSLVSWFPLPIEQTLLFEEWLRWLVDSISCNFQRIVGLLHLLQFFLVQTDSFGLSPHVSGVILRSDDAVAVSCFAFLSTCEGLSNCNVLKQVSIQGGERIGFLHWTWDCSCLSRASASACLLALARDLVTTRALGCEGAGS